MTGTTLYPSQIRAEQNDFAHQFSNWGRWDNDAGCLNLMTPEVMREASKLVRLGRAFNVAHDLISIRLPPRPNTKDAPAGYMSYEHNILDIIEVAPHYVAARRGPDSDKTGVLDAYDHIAIQIHGFQNTHIDAFSHMGHLDRGFNDVPWKDMVSMDGAKRGTTIDLLPIYTRGVLVDVPRIRGIDFVEPGDWLTVEELEQAVPDLRSGDAVIIRLGRWRAPQPIPGAVKLAGIHPDCLGYLKARDAAVLARDAAGDTTPPIPFPHDCPAAMGIHGLCEVYLGYPLIHHLDLEDLAEACVQEGRRDFLFTAAPLKIVGGTGSPIAPICIL